MVKELRSWKCPNCGREYDDEDEAYDCQDECLEKEDAEPGKTLFVCEMCSKKYIRSREAKSCEQKHTDKDDLYYTMYLDTIEKEKLLLAANKPGQTRLK